MLEDEECAEIDNVRIVQDMQTEKYTLCFTAYKVLKNRYEIELL